MNVIDWISKYELKNKQSFIKKAKIIPGRNKSNLQFFNPLLLFFSIWYDHLVKRLGTSWENLVSLFLPYVATETAIFFYINFFKWKKNGKKAGREKQTAKNKDGKKKEYNKKKDKIIKM